MDGKVQMPPWIATFDHFVLAEAVLGTLQDSSCYGKLESGLGSAAGKDCLVLRHC